MNNLSQYDPHYDVKHYIEVNDIQKALKALLQYAELSEVSQFNEALMISSSYHRLEEAIRNNTLNYGESEKHRMIVISRLLKLADTISGI